MKYKLIERTMRNILSTLALLLFMAEYVRQKGLTATMYQDYGWPAKKLK